jgi:hypothetical protein
MKVAASAATREVRFSAGSRGVTALLRMIGPREYSMSRNPELGQRLGQFMAGLEQASSQLSTLFR